MSLKSREMTRSRLRGLAAIIGAALSIIGCVGSEVGQEQVAGSAPVVEVMTQEEMIEEIKGLPTVPELAGECLGPGGEGSSKLLSYIEIAAKAALLPHDEMVGLHETMNRTANTQVHGETAKLYFINRLMYDVPNSAPYDGVGGVLWRYTPRDPTGVNHLYPIEIESDGRFCVNVEPIRDPAGSYAIADPSFLELRYFHERFPMRDLSVYLEKQRWGRQ